MPVSSMVASVIAATLLDLPASLRLLVTALWHVVVLRRHFAVLRSDLLPSTTVSSELPLRHPLAPLLLQRRLPKPSLSRLDGRTSVVSEMLRPERSTEQLTVLPT